MRPALRMGAMKCNNVMESIVNVEVYRNTDIHLELTNVIEGGFTLPSMILDLWDVYKCDFPAPCALTIKYIRQH